jgi:AcrR family transcriptional regulator
VAADSLGSRRRGLAGHGRAAAGTRQRRADRDGAATGLTGGVDAGSALYGHIAGRVGDDRPAGGVCGEALGAQLPNDLDIAADAGIDPALVNRYFGSKEGLFTAVLNSITKDPFALRPFPNNFGEELARMVLRLSGDRHQTQLMALDLAIRSTNSPIAHAIVRQDLEERFIQPLVEKFGGGPDAAARAHIVMSITMGIGVMRGVLGEEAASLQVREEMIAHLAPILDQLADPASAGRGRED